MSQKSSIVSVPPQSVPAVKASSKGLLVRSSLKGGFSFGCINN
ncbi:MAG: hypothetical protein U1F43_09465 [Myxococcota bacterium]